MADFNLIIKAVDQATNTLNKIDRGVKGLEASTKKATAGFNNLNTVIGSVLGAQATRQIIDIVKQFDQLNIRLKSLGSGLGSNQQLQSLTTLAGQLGVSARDTVEAFAQLRLAGLDTSDSTIRSLNNLAIAGGQSLGRTAELVGKALRGEFGKLDDFGIDVQNRYGQFVIKYQGQSRAIVSTSGQVVQEILKIANSTAALDAAAEKSRTLSGALSKLQSTIESGVGTSRLGESIARIITTLDNFLNGTNAVGKAANALASVINFLADNFETIKNVAVVAGSIFLFGKVIQGVIAIVRGLTVVWGVLTTAFTTAGQWIRALTLNWQTFTQALFGSGIGTGFKVLLSYLDDLGRWVSSNLGPLTALGAAIAGLFNFGDKKGPTFLDPKEVERENKFLEQKLRERQQAIANASKGQTPDGIPANTLLQDIIGNLGKTRAEIALLGPELERALRIGDLSLANKLFEEMSNRLEQIGIIAAKPLALIDRDQSMRVQKLAEDIRVLEREYYNTALVIEELRLGLQKSSVELMKQEVLIGQNALVQEKFRQELQASRQELTLRSLRLDDAEYQQILFNQSIVESYLSLEEQRKRLEQLNQAFETGRITLEQYGRALGAIDSQLLGVNERWNLVQDAVRKGNREFDINTQLAKRLRDEVAKGNITWKEYEEAVRAIGQDHFPEYERRLRMLTPLSKELGDTIERSATQASDAFADSFLEILKKGEFTFRSFRDMIENIFNDIARLVIRKAFADPIADAIAGILKGASSGLSLPGGGSGGFGNIFGSIGSAIGGSFGTSLRYGTNFGSQQTAMLAAQDAGMGSSFFSGITDFFSGLWPFAEGGIVTRPTMGLVGEAGPEAVIPLNQYNSMMSGGSSQPKDAPPPVNFTINAIDTQTGVEFLLKNKPAIIKVVQDAYNTRGRRGPLEA